MNKVKNIIEKLKKNKWVKWVLISAIAVFLLALPTMTSKYKILVIDFGILAAITVLGLVVLVGFTGQLTLGQIAYYAIGSYTVGILYIHLAVSPWIGVILGTLVAALFGVMVGIPSFNLRGPFLSIMTISFFEIVEILLTNLSDITGGPFGLSGIKGLTVGGFNLSKQIPFYYFTLALLLLIVIGVLRLRKSRIGRAMIAVNNDETAAPMLGVNPKSIKLISFGLAAGLAGLSGGLYATCATYIVPEAFTSSNSSLYLAMSVISGFNAWIAPVVAVVLNMLPELMRELEDYYLLVFSIVLIIVIMISAWQQYKANNDN